MPLIKLYANLRKLAGTKELSLTGPTIGAVLNELAKRYPSVGEVIFENGKLRQHIVVTINGHNIMELETPVTEQDIIAVFPPIAGG
jgi:MoaD family protein